MEDSFFFSVLRISVAQILKSSGFDKCKPLVLDAITGLYIKHLELVLSRAKKFAITRSNCTNEMLPQDLTQALLDVLLIKPLAHDEDDQKGPEHEDNTKSLDSFVRWLQYSDSFRLSKKLNEVPTALIHNLVEKRKVDISAETDQERKKRRLRERQEYYNQFKHGETSVPGFGRLTEDFDEDEITSNEKLSWLTYLAEKDLKLGHNLKFANTCIQDAVVSAYRNTKFHPPSKNGETSLQVLQSHLYSYNKNDYMVLHIQEADEKEDGTGGVQPSTAVLDILPYNVKYSRALLSDDMEQYFKYAEEHPGEVQQIHEGVLMKEEDEKTTLSELEDKLVNVADTMVVGEDFDQEMENAMQLETELVGVSLSKEEIEEVERELEQEKIEKAKDLERVEVDLGMVAEDLRKDETEIVAEENSDKNNDSEIGNDSLNDEESVSSDDNDNDKDADFVA